MVNSFSLCRLNTFSPALAFTHVRRMPCPRPKSRRPIGEDRAWELLLAISGVWTLAVRPGVAPLVRVLAAALAAPSVTP